MLVLIGLVDCLFAFIGFGGTCCCFICGCDFVFALVFCWFVCVYITMLNVWATYYLVCACCQLFVVFCLLFYMIPLLVFWFIWISVCCMFSLIVLFRLIFVCCFTVFWLLCVLGIVFGLLLYFWCGVWLVQLVRLHWWAS